MDFIPCNWVWRPYRGPKRLSLRLRNPAVEPSPLPCKKVFLLRHMQLPPKIHFFQRPCSFEGDQNESSHPPRTLTSPHFAEPSKQSFFPWSHPLPMRVRSERRTPFDPHDSASCAVRPLPWSKPFPCRPQLINTPQSNFFACFASRHAASFSPLSFLRIPNLMPSESSWRTSALSRCFCPPSLAADLNFLLFRSRDVLSPSCKYCALFLPLGIFRVTGADGVNI